MRNGVQSVDLAEKIAGGDPEAETELVRQFGPPVYALLCARTHDREACQDLLQDVFLGVLSALRRHELRAPEKLPAFVASVARHVAQTHLRELVRDRELRPETRNATAPEAEYAVERAERQHQVRRALSQLCALDRDILTRALQGQKLTAIARALELTPDAVRQRKFRALKKLVEFVGKG